MEYKRGQSNKNKAIRVQIAKQMRTLPLPTWDKQKFLQVCGDRGYTHERTVVYAVAEELGLARATVQQMLSSGRMRWEQILVIGAMFEMTPKEFADVFLSGFFVETEQGHYRCAIKNPSWVLNPPKVRENYREKKKMEILEDLDNIL